MPERSARGMLLCLSLFIGMGSSSVSAVNQVSPCTMGLDPIWEQRTLVWPAGTSAIGQSIEEAFAAPALGLLTPAPGLATTTAPSAAGDMRCLPAVPRSLLMVALGFVCVSAVHDRRMWLAVVASTLSLGYAWPQSVLPSYAPSRPGRHIGHPGMESLSGKWALLSAVSPGRARPCGIGGTFKSLSAAVLCSTPPAGDVLPCRAFVVDARVLRASELTFSQLARGPPASSGKRFDSLSRRVGARKALLDEGWHRPVLRMTSGSRMGAAKKATSLDVDV